MTEKKKRTKELLNSRLSRFSTTYDSEALKNNIDRLSLGDGFDDDDDVIPDQNEFNKSTFRSPLKRKLALNDSGNTQSSNSSRRSSTKHKKYKQSLTCEQDDNPKVVKSNLIDDESQLISTCSSPLRTNSKDSGISPVSSPMKNYCSETEIPKLKNAIPKCLILDLDKTLKKQEKFLAINNRENMEKNTPKNKTNLHKSAYEVLTQLRNRRIELTNSNDQNCSQDVLDLCITQIKTEFGQTIAFVNKLTSELDEMINKLVLLLNPNVAFELSLTAGTCIRLFSPWEIKELNQCSVLSNPLSIIVTKYPQTYAKEIDEIPIYEHNCNCKKSLGALSPSDCTGECE